MFSKLLLIAGLFITTLHNAFAASFSAQTAIAGLNLPTALYLEDMGKFAVAAEKAGIVKLFLWNTVSEEFDLHDTLTIPNVFDHESHGLTALTVRGTRVYFGYSEALSTRCTNVHPAWSRRRLRRDPKDYYDCVITGRIGYVDLDDATDPTAFVDGSLVLSRAHNQHCMQFGESAIGGIVFADTHLLVGYGAGPHPDTSMRDVGQYGDNLCNSEGVFDSQNENKFNGKIVLYEDADLDNPLVIAKGLYNPWGLTVEEVGGVFNLYFADNANILDNEEINKISDVTSLIGGSTAINFGFPCYQGDQILADFGFDTKCTTAGLVARPEFIYKHPTRRGAISALTAGPALTNLYHTDDYLDTTTVIDDQELYELDSGATALVGNYFYFCDPVTLTTYAVNVYDPEDIHEIYYNALFTSLTLSDTNFLFGTDMISGGLIVIGTKNVKKF